MSYPNQPPSAPQLAPPQLTPASLFEEQTRLDKQRLQVYNRILSFVHQKIKFTSTLPNQTMMTYYDFPEWQPGCPCFNVKDCILYVVWNLRQSGFKVLYISPNRLLISWNEQSERYYTEISPIRQAMLTVAQPRTEPMAPPNGSIRELDVKKTSSYQPPTDTVLPQSAVSRKSGSNSTITFI
jgi:hypothetical protein